jgi:hypothetical protein
LSESHGGRFVALQCSGAVPPVAARFAEYTAPLVPFGSEAVVTTGRGFRVRLRGFEPTTPAVSVAVAVRPYVIGCVTTGAMPDSCPVDALIDNHGGSPTALNR